VFKCSAATSQVAPWSCYETNGRSYVRPFTKTSVHKNSFFKRDTTTASAAASYGLIPAGWHYSVMRDNGTTHDAWIDGVRIATASNSDLNVLNIEYNTIGRGTRTSQYWDDEIAELILFSGNRTDDEIADLNLYLKTKYNL